MKNMIWIIIGVLLLLWLIGVIFKFLFEGVLHLLLIAAVIILVYKLVKG